MGIFANKVTIIVVGQSACSLTTMELSKEGHNNPLLFDGLLRSIRYILIIYTCDFPMTK